MFGGLHIEIAALRSPGVLLQCSGWTGAIVEFRFASSGTAETLLIASSVIHARQARQSIVSNLDRLMMSAYDEYCVEETSESPQPLTLEDWCGIRRAASMQCLYWYIVLTMKLMVLGFDR